MFTNRLTDVYDENRNDRFSFVTDDGLTVI